MSKIKIKLILFTLFSILFATSFNSCKNKNNEETVEPIDSNKSNIVNINGTLFSIPSPIQTSVLLKRVNAPYNKKILNAPASISKYSTVIKRALNLGVYGADLGYVIMNQQTQDALGYMQAVRKLADDLSLSAAFNEMLIKRFQSNMGNKDSLLVFVSEAYRSSDLFLKNNERNLESSLVVAGGWIESLYFLTEISQLNINDKSLVISRIGEQKNTLDNLIKLLTPSYQVEGFTEIVDALIDLASEFDKIEVKYTYIKPTTDEANKITTIDCSNEVILNDELLKVIVEKTRNIRTLITE
jgi:hypothetical protein